MVDITLALFLSSSLFSHIQRKIHHLTPNNRQSWDLNPSSLSPGYSWFLSPGNNFCLCNSQHNVWHKIGRGPQQSEPGSDHVAAFQIARLHSLCQVILLPHDYSFMQSSICSLTSVDLELLFCFLFCATGGSPWRWMRWDLHLQKSSESPRSK